MFIYKGMGTRSFCIGNPVVEYLCAIDIEYANPKLEFPHDESFMGHGDYTRPALDSEIKLLEAAMDRENWKYDPKENKLIKKYNPPL